MTQTAFSKHIVVTGGAGFIGSNLLRYMVPKYPDYLFINVDCLTYAANLANLKSIEKAPNYRFEKIDIAELEPLGACFEKHNIDSVIHLAAESHVDRSITGPAPFIRTNITGTFNLLELARARVDSGTDFRFHHISTDEVYGSLPEQGYFTEQSRFNPSSPYAASKAAADHMVGSYYRTYGVNVVATHCSNNYGPYQFPEKLIPLMIRNILKNEPLPVYGDGRHVRDWLHVEDHCRAIDTVFHKASSGKEYNVGGNCELANIDLVMMLCKMVDEARGSQGSAKLIKFVEDRPGHDRRYAIDASLIRQELGWVPERSIEPGLNDTVGWYMENLQWLENCTTGEYQKYYDRQYNQGSE